MYAQLAYNILLEANPALISQLGKAGRRISSAAGLFKTGKYGVEGLRSAIIRDPATGKLLGSRPRAAKRAVQMGRQVAKGRQAELVKQRTKTADSLEGIQKLQDRLAKVPKGDDAAKARYNSAISKMQGQMPSKMIDLGRARAGAKIKPRMASDFDGIIADDNRAIRKGYVNATRNDYNRVRERDLGEYNPWEKQHAGVPPTKNPYHQKKTTKTLPSGQRVHISNPRTASFKDWLGNMEPKNPNVQRVNKQFGGRIKGTRMGSHPGAKTPRAKGSQFPFVPGTPFVGGGVWHSMERHNVPLDRRGEGAVSALKRIEKATGQPTRIATARIPGASMKAATGSLRNAGFKSNRGVSATSTKNKLEYAVRNNITDFPEDKPAELKHLVKNGPSDLNVHTLKHPWTTRHVAGINKEMKQSGSPKRIKLHSNMGGIADSMEKSMDRWRNKRTIKKGPHYE